MTSSGQTFGTSAGWLGVSGTVQVLIGGGLLWISIIAANVNPIVCLFTGAFAILLFIAGGTRIVAPEQYKIVLTHESISGLGLGSRHIKLAEIAKISWTDEYIGFHTRGGEAIYLDTSSFGSSQEMDRFLDELRRLLSQTIFDVQFDDQPVAKGPKGPPFQIHLSTALILMFVAGLLIWLNRLPWNTQMTVGDTPGAIFVTEIGRGVPLPYEYWTPGGQVYFVLEILILDVCLALLPLYVAYRICEWIIRAKRS